MLSIQLQNKRVSAGVFLIITNALLGLLTTALGQASSKLSSSSRFVVLFPLEVYFSNLVPVVCYWFQFLDLLLELPVPLVEESKPRLAPFQGEIVTRFDTLAQASLSRLDETCRNSPRLHASSRLGESSWRGTRSCLAQARRARLSEPAKVSQRSCRDLT
ncbi:hypothetical protein DEO72_LG9g2355 [Vigna unguiculata]|uniref:Uncharacterized protein n=1 Tax=Vigna unguiculata TaxID=3917 RepID=A0A4D6N0R0_VIGUN|nr:hypothetical protein DEO72_LG9g2355 [Vigna unguiculata]